MVNQEGRCLVERGYMHDRWNRWGSTDSLLRAVAHSSPGVRYLPVGSDLPYANTGGILNAPVLDKGYRVSV